MSVTFFDANNPARFNTDGDQIGGGVEVNFSNGNATMVLQLMGLYDEETGLYGETSGYDFRRSIIRGLANVDIVLKSNNVNNDIFQNHLTMKSRLERLLTAFSDTLIVRWE